jgi:hypothetical protein
MTPAESPSRLEPCELESLPPALSDATVELVQTATRLGTRLHPRTAHGLAELVAVMISTDAAESLFPRLFPAEVDADG